ncbi:MAG: hypothetical protein Q7R93_03755 [bacterium]|nr:hypothetical protein [bacterium]
MTKTVAEVFSAFQNADRVSMDAAHSGKFDGEAALAIASLIPLLWRCNHPLVLDEKQAAAFQKYQQAVPKDD